jgi:hypothetical protein
LWEGPPARLKTPDCRFKVPAESEGRKARASLSVCAVPGAFQPPVALTVANLPPAGNFFLKRQLQQLLERFALPVFHVGAPGAGHRLAADGPGGPVALPALPAFLRLPGPPDNDLSAACKRPGSLCHVRMAGQGTACPSSMKRPAVAGGDDPGPVDGLGGLLREGPRCGQEYNQAEKDEEPCTNLQPPVTFRMLELLLSTSFLVRILPLSRPGLHPRFEEGICYAKGKKERRPVRSASF